MIDRRPLIGLALVLGAVAALAVGWLRPDPFRHDQTLRALFTDAGGLARIGADVRVAGTPVGRVESRRRRGDLALVTMRLDRGIRVTADATAELRPRLLFEGTAYVDLHPGSPGAGPLRGTIPPARTRSYVSAADALDVLAPPERAALRADARGLRAALGGRAPAAVRRALGSLSPLLRDAGATAAAARGPGGEALVAAVRGFSRTARAVAARRRALVPLAADGGATARALDASGPLDAALIRMPATLADARSGAEAASALLVRLRGLALRLRVGAARLSPTVRAVTPLLTEAPGAARAARPLLADARATLGAGARAARPAWDALAALDGSVGLLDRGLLGALERPTSLGTPAYLAFLGLFAGGGGASRPYTPGAGHLMRFGFRFLTGAGSPAPPCGLLARAAPAVADQAQQAGACRR